MWILVVKFVLLILLTGSRCLEEKTCIPRWFDCGNGKCIAEIWHCDGENDCGNFNDEKDCENQPIKNYCFSSQFQCKSEDGLCIPEKWHCDGGEDCRDGSDEIECNNSTEICTGFICRNHQCIPDKWRCDGNIDCEDRSDEELCPQSKLCNDSEYLCSSGSCILQHLVCNGKKDCNDGSDEGPHCGDPCENATCSQNCKGTPAGPQCYCNDGYELDHRDNKTCNDVNECQKVGFCSHDCKNTIGGYICSCQDGYELVNRTCLATGADPLLIYSTGREVRGITLRSNEYFPVATAVVHISAVDVDPQKERVYWIDVSNKSTIYTAKTDGSDLRSVLSHGLLLPEDIAVDYITNNLYITDSGLRQVLACKTDGRMCHVLHANSEKPRSIALDLDSRLMYWSDWGEHSSGIYRSGMDGSRLISMVSSRIGWPNGIALDRTTSRLYWADAKLHTIEYITLDGTHRSVLLNTTVFHPFSLAIFEDTLYWSDWKSFSLESCDKFTGHKVTIVARQSNRKIMGVHVYHPVLTSKASNPCWSNDCSHMCLMSPSKEYSCACPHGFALSNDQKTCITRECNTTEFQCVNGHYLPASKRCDGSKDCTDGSDEVGCTRECDANDFRCVNGQCLSIEKRCDGTEDCTDGSDEVNCTCDGFFCSATSLCLPWSKVCDGKLDCSFMPDEGELCSTSCADGKINCSDICRKTPQGPKCFCDNGFRLLGNETCEDINECSEFGTCSHVCSNRKGSYKCSCVDGYRLKDDNRSCAAEGLYQQLFYTNQ